MNFAQAAIAALGNGFNLNCAARPSQRSALFSTRSQKGPNSGVFSDFVGIVKRDFGLLLDFLKDESPRVRLNNESTVTSHGDKQPSQHTGDGERESSGSRRVPGLAGGVWIPC